METSEICCSEIAAHLKKFAILQWRGNACCLVSDPPLRPELRPGSSTVYPGALNYARGTHLSGP